MSDGYWRDSALCTQTDLESFFPRKGESSREAKKVCFGCEVRTQCLQYAIDHDERYGIWGGLSERERAALKRDTPRDISRCANGHVRVEVGVTNSGNCRQCSRDRCARYETRARAGLVPAAVVHGTRTRYQLGCRCDLCVAANSAYARRRRGRPLSLGPGAGL